MAGENVGRAVAACPWGFLDGLGSGLLEQNRAKGPEVEPELVVEPKLVPDGE